MLKVPIHVRFNDLDAFNHVNNAVYLTYFEEGRMAYFTHLKWDWARDGLIVARNEVNYRRPLLLDDEPVLQLDCTRIGNKSFDIDYQLFNKRNELVADGKTVLAVYDYSIGQAKLLSDEGRKMLE